MAKRNITTEIHQAKHDGEIINVLKVSGHASFDAVHSDSHCGLCGFTLRKGAKHSWMIQKANGSMGIQLKGDEQVLLPARIFKDAYGDFDSNLSLGFVTIGSDCRKLLPAEFVTNQI